jgi:hypothetical protein
MNHSALEDIYRDASYTQQQKVEASIKAFQHYMNTYNFDTCCQGNTNLFIQDVLYMLGMALDPAKYRFANGSSQFKKDLIEYLMNDKVPECAFRGE